MEVPKRLTACSEVINMSNISSLLEVDEAAEVPDVFPADESYANNDAETFRLLNEVVKSEAKMGLPFSQCQLAICYRFGVGTERNTEKALKWYHEAAEAGNILAQHSLELLVLSGTVRKPSEGRSITQAAQKSRTPLRRSNDWSRPLVEDMLTPKTDLGNAMKKESMSQKI
ncbi:hypothetical protein BC938DRAFT_479401 [Jimgerdemannia flammicorona]|uniref:Uncharacterized protein n=1 Tax=Jimgerdemannia flammicorona TaxID=994334 RepID=A0A433QKX9_9FUNG|nr:hypothetical protein BC938DRAFT_479401 [Jimgerdemannia flammicorona]